MQNGKRFHQSGTEFNPYKDKLMFEPPTVRLGFDIIQERTAKIISGIAEADLSNVLHVYPEGNFHNFFGEKANFELVGFSDVPEERAKEREFIGKNKYRVIKYEPPFSTDMVTRFEDATFNFVYNALPLDPSRINPQTGEYTATPATPQLDRATLSVKELLRITNWGGYLIMGAPTVDFERLKWKEQLMNLTQDQNDGFGSLGKFHVYFELSVPVFDVLHTELDELKGIRRFRKGTKLWSPDEQHKWVLNNIKNIRDTGRSTNTYSAITPDRTELGWVNYSIATFQKAN